MDLKFALILAVSLFASQAQDLENLSRRSTSNGAPGENDFDDLESTVSSAMSDFFLILDTPAYQIHRSRIQDLFSTALDAFFNATGDCRDVIVADLAASMGVYSMVGHADRCITAVHDVLRTKGSLGLDIFTNESHPLAGLEELRQDIASILGNEPDTAIFESLRNATEDRKPPDTLLGDILDVLVKGLIEFSSKAVDDRSSCSPQPQVYQQIANVTSDFLNRADFDGYQDRIESKLSEYLNATELEPLMQLLRGVLNETRLDMSTLLRAMSMGRDETTTHVISFFNKVIIEGIYTSTINSIEALRHFLTKEEIATMVQTLLHDYEERAFQQLQYETHKFLEAYFTEDKYLLYLRFAVQNNYDLRTGASRPGLSNIQKVDVEDDDLNPFLQSESQNSTPNPNPLQVPNDPN